jgi:hypothetical protein
MSVEPGTGVTKTKADAASLYLELLKDVLVNNIYGRFEYISLLQNTSSRMRTLGHILHCITRIYRLLHPNLTLSGEPLISHSFDPEQRNRGADWPAYAYTMVRRRRLDHLQQCLDTIEREGIPGDFMETGIWRGGVCIFVAGYLKVRGIGGRTVWGLDSFEGLPKPNPDEFPADENDLHHTRRELRVSLESVQKNLKLFGLLDDGVRLVKGFFFWIPFPPCPCNRSPSCGWTATCMNQLWWC